MTFAATAKLLCVALALSPPASVERGDAEISDDASPPEGPEPEASASDIGQLSAGGEDRGTFELGLGSVVLAVGVGLVVAGSVDLVRAADRRRACSSIETADANCELDPPGLIYASSVLAFTFALPAFVGGSLLLHRGVKIHRDYRAVRDTQMSLSLTPMLQRRRSVRGAMFGMRLRF